MYIGRFAPSPTGPLHAGSLVAALASWLDARAHAGRWLVRIEDIDTPRCVPSADQIILSQLAACGLMPDQPPTWQSQHTDRYQAALDQLVAMDHAYPCACSRKDIEAVQAARGVVRQRGSELPYPGTCRPERGARRGQDPRAWRLHTGKPTPSSPSPHASAHFSAIEIEANERVVQWQDRRLGQQRQAVEREVGDFVLRRADGLWAYQIAVVVDDAAQGITDVVRGEDLADNTPRRILLQHALGLPMPRYLHTPLVLADDGQKLSKQNGARALDLGKPIEALRGAAQTLALCPPSDDAIAAALNGWSQEWRARWLCD